MISPFKVGEMVVVSDDQDNAPFCGVTGKVFEVGVSTAGGEGLIFDTVDYGLMKGCYDMFERVQ